MCNSKQAVETNIVRELFYDQWLNQIHHTEKFDFWSDEEVGVTNQQIIEMSLEDRPPEWWNGFEASQEEIDERRKAAKNSLEWYKDLQQHAPNLDAKAERKRKVYESKLINVGNCGKMMEVMGKNCIPHRFIYRCKEYDLCHTCADIREQEHVDRLRELDGCQFVLNDRKNTVAQYTTDITYSFKLKDGREFTVIKSDEKIENAAGEISYSLIKDLKDIQITGTKTSGKAGKKEKDSEPKETRKVFVPMVIAEGTREQKDAAEKEFYKQTKDDQPQDLEALERYIRSCAYLYIKLLEKYCEAIHILGKRTLYITEDDIDLSKRREYISNWLEKAELRTT